MITRAEQIAYKVNIKSFLNEIRCLTSSNVDERDLDSYKKIRTKFNDFRHLVNAPVSKFVINFKTINSFVFENYINNLCVENSSPVYIWLPKSEKCGMYKMESIKCLNLTFTFESIVSEIVEFFTEDGKDKMLFDFVVGLDGNKYVEIKVEGYSWVKVKFNLEYVLEIQID